jgi:hypothetical protein
MPDRAVALPKEQALSAIAEIYTPFDGMVQRVGAGAFGGWRAGGVAAGDRSAGKRLGPGFLGIRL